MLKYNNIEIILKFNRDIERFIKLGYKCELKKPFTVKIKDLKINSSIIVQCICEICSKNTEESYNRYLINKNNHYYSCSSKCSTKKRELTNLERYGHKNSAHGKEAKEKTKETLIKKYGVDSPLKSKEIRDKFSKTMEIRHGNSHALQNKDIKEKAEQTTLKKYGVKNSYQSDIIKDKIKETNLERYGVDNPMKSKEILEKVKNVNLERYGVDNPMKSKEILEKVKNTNLERYGVKYPLQNKEVLEKLKNTNLERYGFEYTFQSDVIKEYIKSTNLERYGFEYTFQSEEFKEKAKETMLKKYGVDNAMKYDTFKEKVKETMLKKYGVDNAMKYDTFKEKAKETNLERYGTEYYIQSHEYKCILLEKQKTVIIDLGIKRENIINVYGDYMDINCHICNTEYTSSNYFIYQRLKYSKTEPCTHCNPINSSISSGSELKVLQFIKDNYTGTILSSDRKILDGKELDIYLPDLGLAFEFNGVYWHNELYKDKDYHLNKTINCLNKDIQLIHIYEDDWNYKQDVVKSRILNLLGKSNKIYARKCIIKEVDSKDSRSFLDNNHIQGNVNSKIKLGLYYNGELVSLMTFGGLRKNLGQVSKEGSWELLRFCNILNVSVIGGASRLFKYFKLNYLPKEVISYADRSWSKGGLYENLGFSFVNNTMPNYYYVVDGIRKNRFGYRKDILVKEGYDSSLTERDIMMSRDIYRIYDSGSIKFKLNIFYREEDIIHI